MIQHWEKIVRDADSRADAFLAMIDRDPASPSCGGCRMDTRYYDPKPSLFLAANAIACSLQEKSRHYRSRAILDSVALSLGYAERVQNPDGTFDFTPCNFRSPPDTAFIVRRIVLACDLIAKLAPREGAGIDEGLEQVRDRLLALIAKAGKGMSSLGFHTPNHRWALASALESCARLCGEGSFRKAAEKLLVEGIDNNVHGEYAERSAGNYNFVNNEQMIALAEERGDPSFYRYVARNLKMMEAYVDPDGSVFTNNSTRQDRGVKIYLDHYWPHYYLMGRRQGRGDFLSVARRVMDDMVQAGRPSPDCLDRLMLEGGTIDYGDKFVEPPTSYEKHFSDSGIARIRRGRWSCSLLRDSGRFLYFQAGALSLSLKLGLAWFERREVKPAILERIEGGYRLALTMKGWYYLPFEEYQGTSDWWEMDAGKRKKLEGPELEFGLVAKERAEGDGIDISVKVEGWKGVPLRFEMALSPGAFVESEAFYAAAKAGEAILAKSGMLRIRKDLDAMELGPAFCEHHDIGGTYGSKARSPEHFTIYSTAFTPVDKAFSFRSVPPGGR
jgi:hypothetical protein